VSGGKVARSVLSHNVEIGAGALVEDSVLLDGVRVGDGARIRKAIIDNEVLVPNGFSIGRDLKSDKARFSISPGGVVVVPRGISLR
jgi:glucose-1-phosphate adenylyltransferase